MTIGPSHVPLIIRGEIKWDPIVRSGDDSRFGAFHFPDARVYIDDLVLRDSTALAEVSQLPLEEVVDYLAAMGELLDPERNPHLQHAFEQLRPRSSLPGTVLRQQYVEIRELFGPSMVLATAGALGPDPLSRWSKVSGGTAIGSSARARAFGSRALHIIAGNSPAIAASTIVRNAIARSDAIIKTPANDPFTAVAIARTMIDHAPSHPLTRRLSVAYWKGGTREIETRLLDAACIDKLVAWGGVGAIAHAMSGLRPGIELITLDPKSSISILDLRAVTPAILDEVALALAKDVCGLNQEACFSTRVAFAIVEEADSDAVLRRLGSALQAAYASLPSTFTAPAPCVSDELASMIQATRLVSDTEYVLGGGGNEGAVIVSRGSEPVEYAPLLSGRVVNLVPISRPEEAFAHVTSATQTVAVYPDDLRRSLRDTLGLLGAQRIVRLGESATSMHPGAPHDGTELMRRLVRWVVDEEIDQTDNRAVPDAVDFERTAAG